MSCDQARDFPATSWAQYDGAVPADLLHHVDAHVSEFGIPVSHSDDGLHIAYAGADVTLQAGPQRLSVRIAAADDLHLYQIRESVLYLLDLVFPQAAAEMQWQGLRHETKRPPNFHLATVVSVRRIGANFLRVEMACDGIAALSQGGMHFSLLLPPAGRAPVWPSINDKGRTVWPEGADSLHRSAYTFVELDAEMGSFAFDVYEHDGGRTTEWARQATAGEVVAAMGPGGGDFPDGELLLMAGDETALPAIRRILQHSDPARRGTVLIEIGDPGDKVELPRPEGISVEWLLRGEDSLWDRLAALEVGGDPFVWIAAEQDLVRRAKAHFRTAWDVPRAKGYYSAYWIAG